MARYLLGDVAASLQRSARLAEESLHRRAAAFAELAIEFDCRMTTRWNRHRGRMETTLEMARPVVRLFDRRPVRRVRIVCRPADGWLPVVHVDGLPFTTDNVRTQNHVVLPP